MYCPVSSCTISKTVQGYSLQGYSQKEKCLQLWNREFARMPDQLQQCTVQCCLVGDHKLLSAGLVKIMSNEDEGFVLLLPRRHRSYSSWCVSHAFDAVAECMYANMPSCRRSETVVYCAIVMKGNSYSHEGGGFVQWWGRMLSCSWSETVVYRAIV